MIFNMVPSTITPLVIKYLEINLTKYVYDLYIKYYTHCWEKFKET